MRPAPVNDDLACYGQPRRGYLKSSQRIKFREAPAPLDAVETDDVDDGGKRAPGARLGREVVGRELGHLLGHDAAARLRLIGLVDGVLRRGVRRGRLDRRLFVAETSNEDEKATKRTPRNGP